MYRANAINIVQPNLSWRSLLAAGLLICTPTTPLWGQESSDDPNQIQAVFRISQKFVDAVAEQEPIVADIPFAANVIGFCCTGTIHGEGKASVKLQDSGDQAIFAIDSLGNGNACVRGRKGPIIAFGSAWGPFTSQTLVQFDGRHFSHLKTTPSAQVHAKLHRVTGPRDRPLGRMFGAGMKPIAEHMVPRAIAAAGPVANRYLQQYVENMAGRIIQTLNATTPVEETVARLFPHMRDWVFQMSSDEEFLQAAFGPPHSEVPNLPEAPADMDDVRMEVWLRSTSEEAELLASAGKSPLAKQLVQKYLESSLPELAALAKERRVDAIGSWVLIRIGEGEIPDLPIERFNSLVPSQP